MKKIVSVAALAMCLVFALSSFAVAAEKPADSIQWDSGAAVTPHLSINGTVAECRLYVNAENASDSITATVMLQKKQSNGTYSNVKTWSKLTGKGTLNFSENYSPVSSSNSYRLKAIVYVTGSGGTDTIVKFSN